MKNARNKLEIPMTPVMPCEGKIHLDNYRSWRWKRESFASQKVPKTKYGCIVESHECTRPRAELPQFKHHEDHFEGKGNTSMDKSIKFGSQIYPTAASDKKYRCKKQQYSRNGRSSRRSQPGIWRKSDARRRLFLKHTETKRKSTLSH